MSPQNIFLTMDMSATATRPLMMSIAAVERDTGLSKDTLRVWERRYGFPLPGRDAHGERSYPLDQVEKLRLIKRLLDVGHRPSRVVGLVLADLRALTERTADAQGLGGPARRRSRPSSAGHPTGGRGHLLAATSAAPWNDSEPHRLPPSPWLEQCLALVDQHDPVGLQRVLRQRLVQLGLGRFLDEVATPLLSALGTGWLRGRFQVYQEHWVSHQLQQCLHTAIQSFPTTRDTAAPRVLLSTLPGELHGLGLLMVEAWLCLEGAQPINLGPQTPLWDLVHAANHCGIDVVALSFSAYAQPQLITEGLPELRSKLPAHVDLWVGGGHPLLQRRVPEGITVLDSVPALQQAVGTWRSLRAERL